VVYELAGNWLTCNEHVRTNRRFVNAEALKHWGVLDVVRAAPRQYFLDEALSHRCYGRSFYWV